MSCDQSPGLFINILIPTLYRSMFNLTLIGQAVSEK